MRCATCNKETREVRRVVIDSAYDKTLAKAIYNCPECYEKKLKAREQQQNKKQ